MAIESGHVPVLLTEVLALLQPERGGWFADCTVGLAGHAEALLERGPRARVFGIDRDPAALERARLRLERFGDRARLECGDYRDLPRLLAAQRIDFLAGCLVDLGVSSLQLDTAERGFSFRYQGPLDMRMGGQDLTAFHVVNQYEEYELTRIFRDWGEERDARRIARTIAAARRERPIATTIELRGLILRAKGGRRAQSRSPGAREGRVDAATRVFQALRIEVNRELAGLDRVLEQMLDLLDSDGRLVVISYHSLEDRIVKRTFRDRVRGEIDPVSGRPLSEQRVLELLTKKPLRPSETEVRKNPRSRSARLRGIRRL
jgi:16S rRNA (cytosine1402-N4)-methyltransferase